MRTTTTRILAAVSIIAASAVATRAQSINVDFEVADGPGEGVPGVTFAGAGGYSSAVLANNYWNAVSTVGFIALRDVYDQPTTVSLDLSGTPFYGAAEVLLTDDFERLIADWVRPSAPLQFSGLQPGIYTVITYAGSSGDVNTQTVPASAPPTRQEAIDLSAPFNGFFAGVGLGASVSSHTMHETVVGVDGNLRIFIEFPSARRVAGIQLVRRGGSPTQLSASISTPVADTCVSGQVPIIGTVLGATNLGYSLAYATAFSGPYTIFATGSGPSVSSVLGTWNTSGLPLGQYFVRLTASEPASIPQTTYTLVRLKQINTTPPVTILAAPAQSARVCGSVNITGTVSDPNLTNWTVDYGGPLASGWTNIASGTAAVTSGTLATWNTAGLPRGPYVLRLRASSPSSPDCQSPPGMSSETLRTVVVGLQADTTFDGSVNTLDLSWLLAQFGQSCN